MIRILGKFGLKEDKLQYRAALTHGNRRHQLPQRLQGGFYCNKVLQLGALKQQKSILTTPVPQAGSVRSRARHAEGSSQEELS